jgi:predicted esterase
MRLLLLVACFCGGACAVDETGEEDSGPLTGLTSPGDETGGDGADDSADETGADGDDGDVPPPDVGGDDDTCPSEGSGGPTGSGVTSYGGTTFAYYVPPSYDGSRAFPILYSQHGSGGSGTEMTQLWSSLSQSQEFIVIGQFAGNPQAWNSDTDVYGFEALVPFLATQWNVDECRQYLHGYSAGGSWAHMVGLYRSDMLAGYAAYAGTFYFAEAAGAWPGMVPRKIAVRIDHGTNDPSTPFGEATYARDTLLGGGHEVSFNAINGGTHAYDASVNADVWDFLVAHHL